MTFEQRHGIGLVCVLDGEWVPMYGGGKLCPNHLMQLAMVCYGKARRNLDSASAQVKRRTAMGESVRAYRCPVCSTHHVGGFDPAREGGYARAEALVKELRAAGFGWYVGTLAGDWHPSLVVRDAGKIWKNRVTR